MRKYTIGLDPFDESNLYIQFMIDSYNRLEQFVIPLKVKDIDDMDFIMLNWFETVSGKNPFENLKIYFGKIIKLMFFCLKGKKIVWTIHNKQPHRKGTENKLSLGLSKSLMKLLAIVSYKIIVHSMSTNKLLPGFTPAKKTVYVPHTNFINCYGVCSEHIKPVNEKLKLLFFGEMLLYKNVNLVIEAIKELNYADVELTIVGKASDDYQKLITGLIGNTSSICIRFCFIADNEIPDLIASHHVLVTPFDLESCINSSTAILAFSYKRTVLSSEMGTLADIPDKNIYFGYTYNQTSEHTHKLKECIAALHDQYAHNYNAILKLGEQCYEYMLHNNSVEKTTEGLASVFK
jgi:glycosyltransferase involved in cell wall biosynthesis